MYREEIGFTVDRNKVKAAIAGLVLSGNTVVVKSKIFFVKKKIYIFMCALLGEGQGERKTIRRK